ncbi:MAG: SseB family protein [Rhodocyclaceae bacterium]|nr:MAG: SseB protein [Betaproteobacteria bacterium HGW-Betaproteobacteria-12]
MSDAAPSRNELEALLLDFHAGNIVPEEFARRLLDAQVFMPVKDEKHRIAGFQASTQAEPLLVEDDAGNRILVLFSAPDRAQAFLAAYPGHGGGMLAEFSWLLRRMGAGIAISINPDQTPGFDLDPEMVAMVAALLPEEDQ